MMLREVTPALTRRLNLMNAIADPHATRADIAEFYASYLAIADLKNQMDFAEINRAILKRWSPSGLTWIKERAWKLVEEKWRYD